MIKLIVLDFNGVIVLGSYIQVAARLARNYNMDAAHVYKTIYSFHDRAALDEIPEEDIFIQGLAALGINEDPMAVRDEHYRDVAQRNEPVIAYAQELRQRGYTVIGLSKNVPHAFAETVRMSRVHREFDAIINTYDLGLPKASRETIEKLVDVYGLEAPTEMIFVEDTQENLVAAIEMGVHTFLYKDNNDEELVHFIEALCA